MLRRICFQHALRRFLNACWEIFSAFLSMQCYALRGVQSGWTLRFRIWSQVRYKKNLWKGFLFSWTKSLFMRMKIRFAIFSSSMPRFSIQSISAMHGFWTKNQILNTRENCFTANRILFAENYFKCCRPLLVQG